MKVSSRNLGIIIVVVIIIVAGVALLMHNSASSKQVGVNPTKAPSPAESASPAGSTSGFSAAYRAKVRSNFMNDCAKTLGYGSTSECSCAADYLGAHYSDADLAKLYVQYHESGKIPEAIKTAVGAACPSK
jgi:hypothetical protein